MNLISKQKYYHEKVDMDFCGSSDILGGFRTTESRTITGKVTADDGSEMPGVNVLIKGTKNGVITDASGNYSITTSSENGTLVLTLSDINLKR